MHAHATHQVAFDFEHVHATTRVHVHVLHRRGSFTSVSMFPDSFDSFDFFVRNDTGEDANFALALSVGEADYVWIDDEA